MQTRFKQLQIFLILAIFPVLVLLNGCVSKSYWAWEHDDQDKKHLQVKDEQECRELARKEADKFSYYCYDTGASIYWPPPYDRYRIEQPDWGWNNHYRFLRYQDNLERLFRFCMQAKGWRLVSKEVNKSNGPRD